MCSSDLLACSFTLPAILRFNSEADDGRLHELAIALRMNSIGELHEYVTRLLNGLGVPEMLERSIRCAKKLEELVPEMLTPGRSDNNLRPIDHNSVSEILRGSIG